MLPKLENWSWQYSRGGYYTIKGNVYNHPNYENGTFISISTPISFNETEMILRTSSGSIYLLGECSTEKERQVQYIKDYLRAKSEDSNS